MKRFGEELKYARESRGISLQDISKETRINQKFIEAIEEGNFSVLPQTYVRAFIRAYAKYIGLNPADTITRYEQYLHGKLTEDKQKTQKPDKEEKAEPEKESAGEIQNNGISGAAIRQMEDYLSEVKSPEPVDTVKNHKEEESKKHIKYTTAKPKVNYPALFLIITALIIVVVFIILNLPVAKQKEPERTSFDNVLKEAEKKYSDEKTVPVKDSSAALLPKSDSLTLAVMSDVDVWVNIRMDKDRSDRGMLTANTKKYLRAKEKFIVTASKGRKIKIYLDEKFLGNLSQSDSLRSALITPEGIKSIKIERKSNSQKNNLKMMELKPLEPKLP